MIENDKLIRETIVDDNNSDFITFRKDIVITKEEFLECYNEWIIKPLKQNPVSTSVRPQGEWIIHPHSMIMRCSLCGNEENAKEVGTINPDKYFCSNCGADMRGEE